MQTEYNREFQEYLIEHADKSAEKMMPLVMELFHPKSIVDFGCGMGNFLAKGKKIMGPEGKILGLDGEYVERNLLQIDAVTEFMAVDLTQKINLPGKFDMAISLEVGEHLEEQYADQFIENIVNASDIILFSAALPGQYGVHHVNEQYISYWINKFEKYDYTCHDIIRPQIWWDKEIDLDYRQNTVVFTKSGIEIEGADKFDTKIWDIAHPEFLEGRTKAWRYWMDKVEYIQKKHKILSWLLKKIWSLYK